MVSEAELPLFLRAASFFWLPFKCSRSMTKRSGPIGAEELSPVQLAECESRIGYAFTDKSLLMSALTHASGALHRLKSNERLEFLGDAILGFVVCERLFQLFPDYLEGDLTK